MNHLLIIYAPIVFLISGCASSQSLKDSAKETITFKLDSVFITVYEREPISGLPFIFFNYTVYNSSKRNLNIQIRREKFAPLRRDKAFVIFNSDTLELFSGNFTRDNFTINAKSDYKFDLNLDPGDLMEYYENHQRDYILEQWFLKDVAKHAIVHLHTPDLHLIDNPHERKVAFRDSLDRTEELWK